VLTAKDRPYKKPMKLSEAVKIMGFMKKDKHIDPNIFELFINNKIHYKYAQKEMNPEQID
jgi:HD-GYP domain-containing protein (c-di-GMP phosphodiesterase class II)